MLRETNSINQEEKKEEAKRPDRRGLAAVKGNKITVKTVAITIGMLKTRTIRNQKRLIKFTRRKKFRIKFKEYRKKIWFNTSKLKKYYRLINIKMKDHSGIEHIAQIRYISGLFVVN
jgi:hypothetical protein